MDNTMIASRSNSIVKFIRSLNEKKYRDNSGLFVTEGERFVAEAYRAAGRFEYVVYSESFKGARDYESEKSITVTDTVFASMSTLKTPEGILAVCRLPDGTPGEADLGSMTRIVYLDALQLPDNVGAVIRTAACAGIDAVILGEGTADAFSPKAIRASAANIFRIKVVRDDGSLLTRLKELGFTLYGAHLEGDEKAEIDSDKSVIIIGNEGRGMSESTKGMCDRLIRIPVKNGCDSLNAACAAAVLIYKSIGY